MTSSVYSIQHSLEKLDSLDSDLRFMGFSDLNAAIVNPETAKTLTADIQLTMEIVRKILEKLDDPISEVQNQAVKWYVFGSIWLLFWSVVHFICFFVCQNDIHYVPLLSRIISHEIVCLRVYEWKIFTFTRPHLEGIIKYCPLVF